MKKKVEASKKIIIACYIILTFSLIATFTAMFFDKDISSASQIVLAIIGLVAAANTAYYTKAAIENKLKIAKMYEMDKDVVKQLFVDGINELGNGGIYQ